MARYGPRSDTVDSRFKWYIITMYGLMFFMVVTEVAV